MKLLIDLNKATPDEITFLENYLMAKRLKLENKDIFYEENAMQDRARRDDINLVYLIIRKHNRINECSRAKLEDVKKECKDKLKELTFEEVIEDLEKNTQILLFDSGTVIGLENDFKTFSNEEEQNVDGFERAFTGIINKYIGKELRKYVHVSFESGGEKVICLVKVEGTPHETYVNVDGNNEFYIRSGNSSEKLDVRQATEYIKDHWN